MDWVFQYLSDAMTSLVVMLICAGIAIAALLSLVARLLANRAANACAWSKDPLQPDDGPTRWICGTCRATSFGEAGKPPVACLRNQVKPAA